MRIRLLDSGASAGAFNMGLDQALLEALSRGESPPTLRFYRWSPPCVTIGYFQSMADEVDLEACAARGVDAIRRITGGGAVFHHSEITYSLVLPEGHPLAPADILESYRSICGGLVEGLARLGVDASFAPINDLAARTAEGAAKKVSGNAQTRKLGCLLQHGTVLLDVDLDLMFSLLKVPSEKLKGKLVEAARERVVGIRGLLGREPPWTEAVAALAAGFRALFSSLGDELVPGEPAEAELAAARRIAGERFSSPAWNLRR